MTKIYRGSSKEWVNEYVKTSSPKRFAATGSGEFGIGCYFWLEDLPAAIMSAIQYNANERDWAVVELEFDDADLHRLATRGAGFGSRVIEFEHSRTSPFATATLEDRPSQFVVPKDYSHISVDKGAQTTHAPAMTGAPPAHSFGKMKSQNFRRINADPDKFGLDGKKNELVWQYDLIIGLCAADYADARLVQMKFANHGMTFINDTSLCVRRKVLTGKKITKAWKIVEAWNMSNRKDLFDQYFRGVTDELDLDKILVR